jgi:hypothetical protein
MSRMDWKQGRFSADQETDRMFKGLRGWRDVNGDWLSYYRYDAENTEVDPVYGESLGSGRIYKAAVRVPCLHVTHLEGGNDNAPYGFYTNDDLDATVAFDLFIQMGMTYADIETQNYLRDRVIYERKVFRVTNLGIRGQIQRRDTIVGLTATQCKPDELVDDAQFAQWSA